MTTEEACALAGKWPKDRTVPKQLRVAYDIEKDPETKLMIGMLAEALMVACESEEDFTLVAKYFG